MLPPKSPEHKFWPGKFFSRKKFPPHMCSQNDQRDVGIILSHVCWGRTPPLPPNTAGRAAPAQTPLTARRPRRGRGGGWANGLLCHPPPQSNFLPTQPPYSPPVPPPTPRIPPYPPRNPPPSPCHAPSSLETNTLAPSSLASLPQETCTCAWVNAVGRLFLGKGAFGPLPK